MTTQQRQRLRKALRAARYQSSTGAGLRGFQKHHIEAVLQALEAPIAQCLLEAWGTGYQAGANDECLA